MSRILDLSIYEEETLDITTPKKNILHVKKPTEELAIKILSYQSKAQEIQNKENANKEDLEELIKLLKNVTGEILSYNTDGIDVDEKYMKENNIRYNLQMVILNNYTSWMNEVASDPNSKSPQNRGARRKAIKK
jgi:hypothetical protein